MSEIGNIYARYGEALDWGMDDYRESRRQAREALEEIYDDFVRNLICSPEDLGLVDDAQRGELLRIFREQFNDGRPEVSFAAIDGTCGKEQLSEMMVFYGASYAQNGTLNVGDRIGRLSYERWTPSEDTSFVAYLPVPLNSLSDLENQDWLFRADDDEISAAIMVHTGLMQLAEIYLAYRRVTSEDRPPRILLLDHSLSSTLLSTDVMHLMKPYRPDQQVSGWIGAYIPRWGRAFEPADGLVAHAHPMNSALGVPSLRHNAVLERIVAEITDFWQIGMTGERDVGRSLRMDDFPSILRNRITDAVNTYGVFDIENGTIRPRYPSRSSRTDRTLRQRWYDLRTLFEDTCERLFRERRLDALQLTYPEGGSRSGTKWMDNNDVRFLVGVGLRLLIEVCWQQRVLLLGIVKDSNSKFLFKNFLSVMDREGILSVPREPRLIGTDRLICEMIPLVDNRLLSPWSTIEFDSIFMTMRALLNPDTQVPEVQGVRGDVLAPSDGLFMRSLVQLFLTRRSGKDTPLMGHSLFLDRITYPYFDAQNRVERLITSNRGNQVRPIVYTDRAQVNQAQQLSLLVADYLTRNLFREAIGQPDPLHRADLGAKALGKQINHLVKSSIERFRTNPLAWSFRDTRDGRSS